MATTTATATATYDSDYEAAVELIQKHVDFTSHDGNMKKWAGDALNDAWAEGMTIEAWVAKSLAYIGEA